MKPKLNYKATIYEPNGTDACQTPSHALDPLLKYIPAGSSIWEPFAGEGRMVRNLQRFGYDVLGTCITTGQNFFETMVDGADYIVSNPAYGIKFATIERCYALGIPFALLLPVETIGSKRAQQSISKYGCELLLLSRRINFHMPNIGFGANGKKSSAQFPVAWYCWHVLPAPICCGEVVYYPEPEE